MMDMDESVTLDSVASSPSLRWPTAAEFSTLCLAVVALLAATVVLIAVAGTADSVGEPGRGLVVTSVAICLCAAVAASLSVLVVTELAGRASWPTVTALALLAATSALLVAAAWLTAALR